MTKEKIFDIIKTNISKVLYDLSIENVIPEDSLKNMGANSIDRMEIITMTMEELGVKVPLVDFGEIKNIQGLIDFFMDKVDSQ